MLRIKHKFPASFFEEEYLPFRVDAQTKCLWAALLDLLAEFDRVCRKHSIKYSIDGGTLLGKARHNGIIPWDDDIDVVMLRSEYEKLQKVADEEFEEPYFLQTMQSDPEAVCGHPVLRNSSMTAILKSELKDGKAIYKTYNQGLFMDIFVLENIPDDELSRKNLFPRLSRLRKKMREARNARHVCLRIGFSFHMTLDFLRQLCTKVQMALVKLVHRRDALTYYQQQFEKGCRSYEGEKTKYVSHLLFMPTPTVSRIVARDMVDEVDDVEFMGLKVMMFKEWNAYLTLLYSDWNKYVIGHNNHGGIFFDLDRPYYEYF